MSKATVGARFLLGLVQSCRKILQINLSLCGRHQVNIPCEFYLNWVYTKLNTFFSSVDFYF